MLRRNSLGVEADIVTRVFFLKLFMVHFNGFDFSGDVWHPLHTHDNLITIPQLETMGNSALTLAQ